MRKRTLRALLLAPCWTLAGVLLVAPVAWSQQVLELKPNLQPFPASNLALVPSSVGEATLIFSTTSWNTGEGPLELIAGETGSAGQNVYQRVRLSDGGFYDRLVGTFEWHPQHNHFHFQDYALYTLQPVNAPGGSQRTSSKTTFCVMDTTKIDGSLPGAPKRAVYTTCGPAVQGMSVGWGDTYGNHLAGQGIDFSGNPSGDYKLIIEIDPKKRLIETSDSDNVSCLLLRIDVASSTVEPIGTSCDGPDGEVIVSAIVPSAAPKGDVASVTITGSGFAPGMAVKFENGSGPRPTVSNVTVVDPSTLTATVTLKSGGGGRDAVWDVRVGSGVLADAFTVLP